MSNRQTNRQTGTIGHGGGLGAPGTTGAAGAHDPLGAPGSTGAAMTTPGAPGYGYDPTEYGTTGGGQAQLHRPAPGTDQGYTYGTAGSMGPAAGGYHAGVHVPHTYDTTATGGGYDTGDFGTAGLGGGAGGGHGGFDVGDMGDRTRGHGIGGDRGNVGMTGTHGMGGTRDAGDILGKGTGDDAGDILGRGVGGGGGGYDTGKTAGIGGGGGGGYDTGKMGERTHAASGEKGKYDTGGARQGEGRRRG